MNVSYDLKKKCPDLKRSVKFDEDTMDLYIDIQTSERGDWRRIDADQAVGMNGKRRQNKASNTIGQDELEELLGNETA